MTLWVWPCPTIPSQDCPQTTLLVDLMIFSISLAGPRVVFAGSTPFDLVTIGKITIFQFLTKLGDPVEDTCAPCFPPLLLSQNADPIVKNWAHAVDNQVCGFVTERDQRS